MIMGGAKSAPSTEITNHLDNTKDVITSVDNNVPITYT